MINPKRKGTVLKTVSNADSLDVWGCKILIIRHLIYGELAESGLKQQPTKLSRVVRKSFTSSNLVFSEFNFHKFNFHE